MDENKSWIQIKVNCASRDIDTVSSVMSMVDNGLMIEDFSDVDQILDGVYGDLIDKTILEADRTRAAVSVFIPTIKSPAESELFIKQRLDDIGIEYELTHDGVCEEDWADSWKQYYKPIKTGKRLVIVPIWEEYTPEEGETVVLMDPGMAFGTGTHETTRLVMRIMQDLIKGGERVLDVGTGSGILSICASKLGAKSCNAYDIDPVAVKVARENAKDDGCDNITVGVSDLLKGVDKSEGKYDFCVANIVSDIIIRMMPDIHEYLMDGAPLILSGIIIDRADEVRASVKANGFTIEREEKENDWVAMLCRR